jgi:hypothetical protein
MARLQNKSRANVIPFIPWLRAYTFLSQTYSLPGLTHLANMRKPAQSHKTEARDAVKPPQRVRINTLWAKY